MLRVRQIKVPVLKDNSDTLKESILNKLRIHGDELKDYAILKKSIDARDKDNINFIYEVKVDVLNEDKLLKKNPNDIILLEQKEYSAPMKGNTLLNHRPVVIGSGPAGLFCALVLAENNYKPIIIERGKKVEDRVKDVELFWEKGILNLSSNVQFGEGGAGTFSYGKLNTLIKDSEGLGKKVLETFVKYGAPEEILYLNKPHIGTDLLQNIIRNMREDIISMGGTFFFEETFEDLVFENNKLKQIKTSKQTLDTDVLVLAIGHSARDTFYMLNNYLDIKSKPFAIGVRISHPQKWINENQYGSMAKYLPPADYKLTYEAQSGRGVYSFCMCPGGFVVNSSSEDKALCINGMSNYKRDEANANSAIIVTIDSKDYGDNPLSGIEFQRKLEHLAYEKGEGFIPTQRWEDFKNNTSSKALGSINPIYKGNYHLANLHEILPDYICHDLIEAIDNFGHKIKGFNDNDALVSAVESRTSSPVRIMRDETLMANIKGIYPCGEGAGYAGGITSSAIDGIKVAHSIIENYYI